MDKNQLDIFIEEHTKIEDKSISFVDYLYKVMDKYHIAKASDVYEPANISRQLWSSIVSGKSNPSLNVCIKIVFAIKMSNAECKLLLKKAGFTLASSSKYSLIIRYFIENKKYELIELNKALEEYGYSESLIY